ncbi:hypothetical protein QP420_06320 [Bifidobacterium sp. UMB1197]|nr:hypothetical protein [Bifidobacterium sp. UMB1197]
MLPAGLRGFASRVGRLALRAFAWNKGDAVARPARTLLRALLAMILAAATLLAMLVLPPVNKANAYDIYWEYRGEGYLVATSEDNNGKEIRAGTNNARYASGAAWFDGPSFSSDGKTVTWKVVFNPQTYYNASRVDTKYEGNIDDGKGTNRPFGENPIFYAYLPKGVSNINLVRYKYYVERDRRNTSWIRRGYESGNINTCNFSDGGCNTYWNNSVGPGSGETGVGGSNMSKISYNHPAPNSGSSATSKYSVDEIYKWKDEGKFGVGIVDKQSLSYTSRGFIIAPGYEWELSAQLDNGYTKDDFYKMPFIFGVTSDNDRSKGKGNYRKNKFAFAGPFDTDGDGIPDKLDYLLSMHPNDNDQIKYPEYSNSTKQEMLSDFWGAKTGATYYGGGSNVPITSYGIPISVKPFAKIWDWNKNDPIPAHFNDNWNAYKYDDDHPYKFTVDDVNKTTTDLPNRVSTTKPKIGMDYSFYGNLPSGVKEDTGKQGSPCNVTKDKGCVKINHDTGEVTYNPLISDWKRKSNGQDNGLLTFPIEIKYPAPGSYNLVYGNTRNVKRHNLTIRVLSQATQYSPHYDETEVDFHATGNNGKDSAKPYNKAKDGCNARKPLIDKRGKDLPSGVKFIFPDKTTGYNKDKYIFGDSKNPVGESRLSWASLTGKDPLRNTDGIVHFAPSKVTDSGKSFAEGPNNGNHTKTPVVVKYADGSSSEDLDAGNICSSNGKVDKAKSVVYAPVHVKKYPPDVSLDIWEGSGMHGVYSDDSYKDSKMERRYNENDYKEITSIDAHKKIILDSWAKDGDGKIDFRAVCHRTDKNSNSNETNVYSLLTPPDNNGKGASGSINGVKFTGYRYWKYATKEQEKDCKKKGTCNAESFAYDYLTSDSYNVDTLQRSRAVIDGKKFSKDGKYECKVFAFHNGSDSLKKFDKEANDQAKKKDYSKLFDFGNKLGKSDQKGKEWTDNTFKFSVKLKDSQKYNPTYKTMPTIEAGKSIKKGQGGDTTRDEISTDKPKSTKDGNGVPLDEQDGIVVDSLPTGTWFEIKRFVKASEVKNENAKTYPWSRFEDSEDNVTRDKNGDPVKNKGKVVPENKKARVYGSVTFRPDKWQSAGEYWAEVVAHYPDGSASNDKDSINYKHPVYAKVKVTPKPGNNNFGLDLYRKQSVYSGKISVENGINLHPGDSLTGNDRPMFDAYLTNAVGNLHQHMICSKQDKSGKQTDYTYGTLPGHVNNTKPNAKESEKDGLRLLEPQTIWKHSSLKEQLECNADGKKCKSDTFLYDDWVDGSKSVNTFERTHGSFGGKAQKTGDYQCKVYVIKGDAESKKFADAVKGNIKSKKNADPVDGVLNASGNPYGTEGVGYKTDSFSVRIHRDNQLYNPTYTKIPTILAGSTFDKNLKKGNKAAISSDTPQSKKKVKDASGQNYVNANGVPDYDLQNVKEGSLPKGTWYEIKRFVKPGDISDKKVKDLPWANFEDGEDNVKMKDGQPDLKDGKKQQDSKEAKNKGSVTFRPDKWQDEGDYWAEVRVHYPDGSVSDDKDSINKDHPIYAKVKVTRPAIGKNDLTVNVYKQFDRNAYNVPSNVQVDSTDNINNVDSKVGVTVMRGIGLLNDLGVDSWSTAKRDGITLRTLCRDANSPAKGDTKPQVWSENLDKLFFQLNGRENQKVWGHANFQQQEACRKGKNNGDGCDTDVLKNPLLFDSTGGTMERSRGFISNSKAPTDTGKYYCAVFALKKKALDEYKNAVQRNTISVPNNSDIVSAMGFSGTNGIDYAAKFFPVNVVEPFKLPKTGGEDCVNWNMLMSVVCVLGTGAMAAGFFLDQTKWGRAMLEALLRKAMLRKAARGAVAADCTARTTVARTTAASTVPASLAAAANRAVGAAACGHAEPAPAIKAFIRKTAEWCGGVMLRIEWWITERWRC